MLPTMNACCRYNERTNPKCYSKKKEGCAPWAEPASLSLAVAQVSCQHRVLLLISITVITVLITVYTPPSSALIVLTPGRLSVVEERWNPEHTDSLD